MVLAYRHAAHDLAHKAETSHEGGVVYPVDKWTRLRRFLILGTQGGTFYASERAITRENAQIVLDCLTEDPARTIATIVAVSDSGVAPKNDPAILALAIAMSCSDPQARALVTAEALATVCRTGTHILHFLAYVDDLRGWGRALKRLVGSWYQTKDPAKLAYQVVKYQQRDGWSHRDALRLAKPKTPDAARNAIYQWIAKGVYVDGQVPEIIAAYEDVKRTTWTTPEDFALLAKIIQETGLPREALPTHLLTTPEVQMALLPGMPYTALIRNLGNLTKSGVLAVGSEGTKLALAKLTDTEGLRRARIHPMTLLLARKTYEQGRGWLSKNGWTPVPALIDALDDAFYAAFANVEPTGKITVLGIDISGSMQGGRIAGTNLTCAEAAVAMAMVTARTEPNYALIGYTANPVELKITASMRLADAMKAVAWTPQGTKCSVPAKWAAKQRFAADAIINYTDGDTSDQDAYAAVLGLRQIVGKPVAAVMVAMTATGQTVYPDTDGRTLNVAGFDASVPALISDFLTE